MFKKEIVAGTRCLISALRPAAIPTTITVLIYWVYCTAVIVETEGLKQIKQTKDASFRIKKTCTQIKS